MALPNIFKLEHSLSIVSRINKLTPQTPRKWGKMDVAQMLAHCNVTYELVYENKHPKPNVLLRWVLARFVKDKVVSEVPFQPSVRTAPVFIIKTEKDFHTERKRLVDYILRTQDLGEKEFDNKPSISFGPLSVTEWNNMFYKHLDHHLNQFAV